MDLKLTDKVVLVTGSTAGIGFAIARALAAEGAHVYVNGRTHERVDAAVAAIRSHSSGARVDGIVADFSSSALRDGYRQKVFLMTKIDGRDKNTAARQIEESLGRLQTEVIDLLQFHEVIRLDDPDVIFAPGGAIEAVQKAKQASKVRHIGFTGHKDPSVHLRMFETADQHGFHFDTVQMPINVMDAHFRSFLNGVAPVAQQHGTAILAMKTFGDPYILQSKTVTPMEALHFGLNSPATVVITGIDSLAILEQAFQAVENFKPMDQQQVATILAKTKEAAMTGKFELFKTSSHYDGTIKNPSWLGYTGG